MQQWQYKWGPMESLLHIDNTQFESHIFLVGFK